MYPCKMAADQVLEPVCVVHGSKTRSAFLNQIVYRANQVLEPIRAEFTRIHDLKPLFGGRGI